MNGSLWTTSTFSLFSRAEKSNVDGVDPHARGKCCSDRCWSLMIALKMPPSLGSARNAQSHPKLPPLKAKGVFPRLQGPFQNFSVTQPPPPAQFTRILELLMRIYA
jgi:hypothetical protein